MVSTDPKVLRNIEDRAPEWVLDSYIPKGHISLVASPMNSGKTHVAVWMAKEASTGSPLALDTPRSVWVNTQEDDHQMVLRPRLMIAGADADRVTLTSESWQFPRDIDVVRGEVQARSVDLLILDSVQTHIPNFTATGPASEAMQGLKEMGQELDLAVVLIHHFSKGGASSVRASIGGAGVIQNLARGTIFIVGPKPLSAGDVAREVRGATADSPFAKYVLAPVRCGISKLPESLIFELRTKYYEGTKRDEAYLELLEPASITAEQVLKAIKASTGGKAAEPTKSHHALMWLLEVLSEEGPRPVARLNEEAKVLGITERTLERARQEASSEGLIEVIRPADLRELLGEEAFELLGDEERRGFWLRMLEDIGEPPIDDWAKGGD